MSRLVWEYMTVEPLPAFSTNEKLVERFNKLGTAGWELAGIEHGSGGYVKRYIFKRGSEPEWTGGPR